jgi:ribosomal protein S12 methylthiotransferase
MSDIKVNLISLGCPKNQVDSEHMIFQLQEDGMTYCARPEEADVVVINTCGFIENAKREAIETILETAELKKTGQLKGLVVAGCLPQRYAEDFQKELPEVDAVLGTGSYTDVVAAVKSAYNGNSYENFDNIDRAEQEVGRVITTPYYSAYLKIAEGCDNHCAYCVIPSLRGRYRSRQMADVLAEAQGLLQAGVKEIIVIAQDITRYGTDLTGKRMLSELLNKLCEMDFHWIRLHYLYPDEIDDTLIQTIASQPKILKYLDIPIQHVNDRILESMHRRGNHEYLDTLFTRLREQIPGVVLRTSLIVGLPGETDEEFTQLCEFMQKHRIERAGVFTYSPEEGSEAATMPDQIDEDVKSRRQFILEEIQSGVMDDYNHDHMHQEMEVLCEGYDPEAEMYYGRSYADSPDIDGRIYFHADEEVALGDFVMVRIDDSREADLIGTALPRA